MKSATIVLTPASPFDFELTAGSHTAFRGTYGADLLENGVYRRLLEVRGKLLLACVRSTGTVVAPTLELEVHGQHLEDADVARAAEVIAWNLGLYTPVDGFYSMAKGDPPMEGIVSTLYALHPTRTVTVFEALVLAIVAQQISTVVARIIRGSLIEAYGRSMTIDGRKYFAFPDPAVLLGAGVEGLRGMKLSYRKAEYIAGICQAICDGSLKLEGLRDAQDEEVVQRLTDLRGVGQWTAEWLLIRALSRPDAFPAGDLAVKRVISQLYFEGKTITEEEAETFSQRWSPYRSYAVLYMLAASRRQIIAPAP